jgi:hypothetical protein
MIGSKRSGKAKKCSRCLRCDLRKARPAFEVLGKKGKNKMQNQNKEQMFFISAAHLEERAVAREMEAEQLPPGEARQHALNNAAQLRSYAAMKRLLVPDRPSIGVEAKG